MRRGVKTKENIRNKATTWWAVTDVQHRESEEPIISTAKTRPRRPPRRRPKEGGPPRKVSGDDKHKANCRKHADRSRSRRASAVVRTRTRCARCVCGDAQLPIRRDRSEAEPRPLNLVGAVSRGGRCKACEVSNKDRQRCEEELLAKGPSRR